MQARTKSTITVPRKKDPLFWKNKNNFETTAGKSTRVDFGKLKCQVNFSGLYIGINMWRFLRRTHTLVRTRKYSKKLKQFVLTTKNVWINRNKSQWSKLMESYLKQMRQTLETYRTPETLEIISEELKWKRADQSDNWTQKQ